MISKNRLLSAVCCIVVLLSVLFLYACDSSKSTGAENALKAYITANDDVDTDAIIDLVPPAFLDYQYDKHSQEDRTEEEVEAIIETKYKPMALKMDFLKVYPEIDVAEEFTYDYKVIDSYNAKASEVKEFNDYVSNKFEFDMNVDKIVLLKYEFSIESKNDIYEVSNVWDSGAAFEIDGEWYYLNGGTHNEVLWATMNGLKLEDGLEWMFNWLRGIE